MEYLTAILVGSAACLVPTLFVSFKRTWTWTETEKEKGTGTGTSTWTRDRDTDGDTDGL
jgi:hypothetical protein